MTEPLTITLELACSVERAFHVYTERANATNADVRFLALAPDRTRMDIQHGGWHRLGDLGRRWHDADMGGWHGVLPGSPAPRLPGGRAGRGHRALRFIPRG